MKSYILFSNTASAGSLLRQLLFILSCLLTINLAAQPKTNMKGNGNLIQLENPGNTYKDLYVPITREGNFLYLEARGGDGGRSKNKLGGKGALVKAIFKIGYGEGEIPSGSHLRFFVGQKGRTDGGAGGGGGGTGVLLSKGGDKMRWSILAVAGGGGGAYLSVNDGIPGNDAPNGFDTGEPYKGGVDGHSATAYFKEKDHLAEYAGGGGALRGWKDSDGKWINEYVLAASEENGFFYGKPAGDDRVHMFYDKDIGVHGGFGFGSGSDGGDDEGLRGGGGGGGYSGGAWGQLDNGGGGGSYVNPLWSTDFEIKRNGHVHDSAPGYIKYQFFKDPKITIDTFSFLDNFKLAVDGSSRSGLYFTEKLEGPLGLIVPNIKLPADGLSSALMPPNSDVHLTFFDKEAPGFCNESYFVYFLGNGYGMVVNEGPVNIQPKSDGSSKLQVSIEHHSNTELTFKWYTKNQDGSYQDIPNSNVDKYDYAPGEEGKVEITFEEVPSRVIKTITFSTD